MVLLRGARLATSRACSRFAASPRERPSTEEGLMTERDWCSGVRIVTSKDTRLLNRREFNGLCVALSSFVTSSGASALDAATGEESTGTRRTVRFRDGTVVPALGQGSARIGQGRHPAAEEEEA